MGSGTEIIFIFVFGVLLLGPRRLYSLLGQVGKAKGHFEEVRRSFKSQLEAELHTALPASGSNDSRQLDETP